MSEQIKNILSNLKPKEETKESSHEKTAPSVTKIQVNNLNTVNTFPILLAFLFIVILAVTSTTGLLPYSCTQTSNIKTISVSEKITSAQADEIKSLVKEASLGQNKSPLTVHNELKKMFHYYRYREIDVATYEKVIAYLKGQSVNK